MTDLFLQIIGFDPDHDRFVENVDQAECNRAKSVPSVFM